MAVKDMPEKIMKYRFTYKVCGHTQCKRSPHQSVKHSCLSLSSSAQLKYIDPIPPVFTVDALLQQMVEFTEACKVAAVAIAEGRIAPMNMGDAEENTYVYMYNGIFFSKSVDSQEPAIKVPILLFDCLYSRSARTYVHYSCRISQCGLFHPPLPLAILVEQLFKGDDAFRKSAGHDISNQKVIQSLGNFHGLFSSLALFRGGGQAMCIVMLFFAGSLLIIRYDPLTCYAEIKGVHTVLTSVVDYKGERYMAQTVIPGVLSSVRILMQGRSSAPLDVKLTKPLAFPVYALCVCVCN
jgi:Clustered mitochondria